jgi:hypothetical protein
VLGEQIQQHRQPRRIIADRRRPVPVNVPRVRLDILPEAGSPT